MSSKILAVSLAAGAGLVAMIATSLLLAIVIGTIGQAVGLPGEFTTWIALLVGGGVAAYLLPSAWYVVSPLMGFVATVIFQALIPTEPVYLATVGQSIVLPGFRVLVWAEDILLSAAGGYLCHLWIKRRQSKE